MSELGALYKNITASALVKTGSGVVKGIVVNSHTNGTLAFNDGVEATTAGVKATQVLTSDATNVTALDTVTIGAVTYRFMSTMAKAYDVKIGADAATTLDNLKAAINASGTPGVEYFAGTNAHPTVTATTNTNTQQTVEATVVGLSPNSIVTTETSSHLSWGAGTLASGTEASVLICNTITFAAGSQTFIFPDGIIFKTGLYVTKGGTIDCTIVYN